MCPVKKQSLICSQAAFSTGNVVMTWILKSWGVCFSSLYLYSHWKEIANVVPAAAD